MADHIAHMDLEPAKQIQLDAVGRAAPMPPKRAAAEGVAHT